MSGRQKNTEDATSELGTSSDEFDAIPNSRPETAKSSLHEESMDEGVETEEAELEKVDSVSHNSDGNQEETDEGSEEEET